MKVKDNGDHVDSEYTTHDDKLGASVPSLVLAESNMKKTHLTDNHGLLTVLPHLISLTRTGGTASAVTPKAIALEESTKKTGSKKAKTYETHSGCRTTPSTSGSP